MSGQHPQLANGLHWVRVEIEQSLSRVRTALEQYAETSHDAALLHSAAEELRLVQGSVGIIECFGAAVLVDEMLRVMADLAKSPGDPAGEAFSALSGATLQLSDYIDLLAHGEEDRAVILQPAINELRLVRGQPLLTEADLFGAQLRELAADTARKESAGGTETEVPADGAAQGIARRELPAFQFAFLQWFRGQATDAAAARMAKIADSLAVNTAIPALRESWTVLAVMAECLRGDLIPDSLDLKRLLGRAASQVKRLADEGEPAAAAQLGDMTQQLMFHIARASRHTERAQALMAAQQVGRLLPPPEQIDDLRRRLRGPNTSILGRVYAEMRRDFGHIKDGIDLAVRTGGRSPVDLASTRDRLLRLASTLGALGLPAPQQALRNQAGALEGTPPGAGGWMEIATAILRVEHSLEEALFRALGRHGTEPARPYAAIEAEVPHAKDLREAVNALLRESIIELAKLKSGVDQFLREGETVELETAAPVLRQIASALLVIDRARASALLRRLDAYVQKGRLGSTQTPLAEFDRFADAISCVELFLEAVRDRLPDTGRLLDHLESSILRLERDSASAPVAETPAAARTGAIGPAAESALAAAGLEETLAAASPQPPAAIPAPAPVSVPVGEGIDPEIRDIFVEEAGEVLVELQRVMAAVRRDPAQSAAAGELRRGFHTLKGSGRMAGAMRIGEFGWAVEDVLNRCLEGAMPFRAPVIQLVEDAIALLPGLIENFRSGGEENRAVATLIERATALIAAMGRNEQDMLAVFREDARERLGVIRRWLEKQNPRDEGFAVDTDVIRAFHTLRGSAAIVRADGVSQLAAGFENYLNALRQDGRQLPPPALALFADALVAILGWVESYNVGDAGVADLPAWNHRLASLQAMGLRAGAPAEARRPVDGGFCLQALDDLQALEAKVGHWAADPAGANRDGAMAMHLAGALDRLAAAAGTAGCTRIARRTADLAVNLSAWRGGAVPATEFFVTLLDIVEGLYQALDAYRDGAAEDEDAAWPALLQRLPQPLAPVTPAVAADGAEPVQEPPPAADTPAGAPVASDDFDAELREIFQGEAAELLASLDHHLGVIAQHADDADAAAVVRRDLHTLKGSARAAGQHAAGALAQKLEGLLEGPNALPPAQLPAPLATGIEELRELLGLAAAAPAPIVDHGEGQPPELHQLQVLEPVIEEAGAAVSALPADAQPPEPEPEPIVEPEAPVEAATLAELPEVAEAPLLPVALEDYAAADVPAPSETLAEMEPFLPEPLVEESAAGAHEITASTIADALPSPEPPVETPSLPSQEATASEAPEPVMPPADLPPAADTSAPLLDLAEPVPAEPALNVTAASEPAAIEPLPPPRMGEPLHDEELTAIFAAEATELLELLDASFESWQNGDPEAPREVQRALHTLKGGARMAGLEAMADASHEMETTVDRVVASGEFPDAEAIARMRAGLERLQSMHDQVRRGEAELLVSPAPLTLPEPAVESAPAAEPPATAAPAAAPSPAQSWAAQLFWQPEDEPAGFALTRRETARVQVETLDTMLNEAGEISIYRSRLEERNTNLRAQLLEMTQTIQRVRDQLRNLDIETEAQIAARGRNAPGAVAGDRYAQDFDPLEMDRYTRMQELSRALAESIGDLASLQASMDEAVSESETLLLQQSRITSEVQQGLMGTLMVPFSRQVQRLIRVVRQSAQEHGKLAEVQFQGVDAELDRNVLERITAPLEHLLRNAVVHGIEPPAQRIEAGKPVSGTIHVHLAREGGQLAVEVSDDGKGLDFGAIRAKAVERKLMSPEAQLADDDLARFIFEPGFSTAQRLTQDAGRGIGMDVVASEVKQLAGTLELRSETGKGTRFLLRLPLTLAVSQVLLIGVGLETYAVPLPTIEGIARVPRNEIADHFRADGPLFAYGGRGYRVRHIGDYLGIPRPADSGARSVSAILVRLSEGLGTGERRVALVVDALYGNREIVSKSAGPQVSGVAGVAGATILADGRVVLILDVAALIAERARRAFLAEVASQADTAQADGEQHTVMVVDDSVTMRRVAERLLVRNGYRVITAKDGLDAIALLQTETPATLLLDIEMPRADGFEVAAFARNNPRLSLMPIIMITSRSGDKHRERARTLGVDRYLIKPYQEDQLLTEIQAVIAGGIE